MNTRSIRFRLVVWYAGLLTAMFIIFGIFMFLILSHLLESSRRDAQLRRAKLVGQMLLARLDNHTENAILDEINTSYAPELNGRFIRITRPDGSVMYSSGAPKDQTFDPAKIPVLTPAQPIKASRIVRQSDNKVMLVVTVPVTTPKGAEFLVETGVSLGPVHAVQDELLTALIIGLPVVITAAAGGGYLLVGSALAPVDKIARSAEQITLHNLKERLPIAQTGDELERLSIALNHMITRLDEAFQHNRRFMADASHELRTPLTIMRGELEAVVLQSSTTPETQEKLASVLEEVVRVSKIVESLFAISRLDAGEAQTEWVQFDLAHLASTTAEQMCLLAEDKQISIKCQAPQPVLVQGDRARLKQVVVNLLDNAIKYTPNGGAITLTVSDGERGAVLEVADNGIGIAPTALPHVFDRFFRVDTARSREVGGAGIGLSIVKSICTAHGGRVSAESTESKGSRFKVELPLPVNNVPTSTT